jgi:hypothetical protein
LVRELFEQAATLGEHFQGDGTHLWKLDIESRWVGSKLLPVFGENFIDKGGILVVEIQ